MLNFIHICLSYFPLISHKLQLLQFRERTYVNIMKVRDHQQSVGSTGNGVPLSGLTGFAPQFESQGSRLCWENLCLPVRARTSSLGCGTGLKVSPTVGALPRIPHD